MRSERLARIAGEPRVSLLQLPPEFLYEAQLIGSSAAEIHRFELGVLRAPAHDRHAVAGGHDTGPVYSCFAVQVGAAGAGLRKHLQELDHLIDCWRCPIGDGDPVSLQRSSRAALAICGASPPSISAHRLMVAVYDCLASVTSLVRLARLPRDRRSSIG